MNKYLVEASKKNGIFDPFDERKHFLVNQDQLVKMLSDCFGWVVWSVHWVNLNLTPISQLEEIYGTIFTLD